MLIVTLTELAETTKLDDADIVYSYDAPQSARSSDPHFHALGSGIELMFLAARVLEARYGPADYPSPASQCPNDWADGAVTVFAWDFDYDQLLLELREVQSERYVVRVRRRRPRDGRSRDNRK